MRRFDCYLSYLYPVTVERTGSRWNPFLEVVIEGGRLLLNSRNTNYSYGSLHSLFKKAFHRLKPEWLKINNALILGYGAGCVAETILKKNSGCLIDGVEIDSKVIEIDWKYFHFNNDERVTLHCEEATEFIDKCISMYDLIVIDVYNDAVVPAGVETDRFISKIKERLRKNGMVLFNKYIISRESREQFPELVKRYSVIFGNCSVLSIMSSGKILVSKKND